MDLRTGRVALAGALTTALVLAACGGGDDSAESSAGASTGPSAAASSAGRPTATKSAKPKTTAAAAISASAVPAVTTAATKPAAAPKAPGTKTLAYRVAMPDGRTFPQITDWKFTSLKLRREGAGFTGTVDVTYTGPGLASMNFTTLVRVNYLGPDGIARAGQPVEFLGSLTAIRAGATETVQLLGGNEARFDEDAGYEEQHTVESMSDDDPKARAD